MTTSVPQPLLPRPILNALTAVRDAARVVARSLMDDSDHTYVATVSACLNRALDVEDTPADREAHASHLEGMRDIVAVLPRDLWSDFCDDALRIGCRLLRDVKSLEVLERVGIDIGALSDRAELLRAQMVSEVPVEIESALGSYLIRRTDKGRRMEVMAKSAPEAVLFTMPGARSDKQVIETLRFYYGGFNTGKALGADEIRTSLRLIIGAADDRHIHGAR